MHNTFFLTMNKTATLKYTLIALSVVALGAFVVTFFTKQGANDKKLPTITPPHQVLPGNQGPKGPVSQSSCSFRTVKDVQYGIGETLSGEKKLLLDAYIPTECDGKKVTDIVAPVMVIHGGGFKTGDKSGGKDADGSGNAAQFAQKLAERGFAAFSLNYRMMNDKPILETNQEKIIKEIGTTKEKLMSGTAAYDQLKTYLAAVAVEDALKAQKYLNTHSATYTIDKNRWGLTGMSAGAVTVMGMVYAADDWFDTSANAKAVINMWGNFDKRFVEKGELGHLSIVGSKDDVVPYAELVQFHNDVKNIVESRLITADGVIHGLRPESIYTFVNPETDQVIFEDIISYLQEKL